MPDLDQIKQAELGAGTGPDGSPGPVAQSRRPRGCRDHVNRAARLS